MGDYSVYRHVFPNGKVYIGITSQPLEKRFEGGKGYRKCPKVYNAILHYGWNNIEHELLFSGLTKHEAEEKEIELIAFYNSTVNGYNIDHGGNVLGTHSIETRQKISEGNKGISRPVSEEKKQRLSELFSGEGNPFYGKHHTEETKATHSKFMEGNQYNRGNHHTEEFKAWKSKQMKEKYSCGGSPRCRAVIRTDATGNEKRFWSLTYAAKEAGMSASALLRLIRECVVRDGYTWRYADEART